MQKIILHPQLGEITLIQSARSTRVSLRVLSSGVVRLSFGPRTTAKVALRFLEDKKEWVMQAKAKVAKAKVVIEMPFSTRTRSLKLDPRSTNKISAKIDDTHLIFSYPIELNYRDDSVQEALKKAIEELWRYEAKMLLPKRLDILARQHNFKFTTVAIRNTHSRWGSCSSGNSISLSLSLMRLPDYLIDYILLHELCHTVHKNHGKGFYELLDQVCGGNHKKYNAEVKKYSTRW